MICMHLHCDSSEWLYTGYWISLTELPKCRDRHCDADGEVTDRAASVSGEECAAVCAVECRALVTMALNVGTMMFAATRDTLDGYTLLFSTLTMAADQRVVNCAATSSDTIKL